MQNCLDCLYFEAVGLCTETGYVDVCVGYCIHLTCIKKIHPECSKWESLDQVENSPEWIGKIVLTLCPNCKVIRKAGFNCEWCKILVPYPEEAKFYAWPNIQPDYDDD